MVMLAETRRDEDEEGEDAIQIPLRFNRAQLDAWNAVEPYIGLCFGIRGGKTHFGRNWILRQAATYPRADYICTANSYDQLRLVTIPNMEAAFGDWSLPYRHVQYKRFFEVYIDRRTVKIHYRSTDNFDLTRGAEFGAAWMDELRDTKPEALEMMKGRLSSPEVDIGRLLCTTTPNGYDGFYNEFVRRAVQGVHFFRRSRTRDNPFLRPNFVTQIYRSYDPQRASQELDADFLVLGAGKVFSSFSRERNGKGNAYDPKLPMWICVDFNIIEDAGDLELPRAVTVQHMDPALELQTGAPRKFAPPGSQGDEVRMSLRSWAMSRQDAEQVAWSAIWTSQTNRQAIRFALPPSWLQAQIGHLVTLPVPSGPPIKAIVTSRVRGANGVSQLEAVAEAPEVHLQQF